MSVCDLLTSLPAVLSGLGLGTIWWFLVAPGGSWWFLVIMALTLLMTLRSAHAGGSECNSQRKTQNELKTEESCNADVSCWRQIGRVSHLTIYPLKSARGLEVEQATATPLGLVSGENEDRTLVVVGEDGGFINIVKRNKLVLVSARVSNDRLRLDAPERPPLSVELPIGGDEIDEKRIVECRIWGEPVLGFDLGPEVTQWMNSFLSDGGSYRVLHFLRTSMEPRFSKNSSFPYHILAGPQDKSAYGDFSPFLIINSASVEHLNKKLSDASVSVSVRNFRPNLVVSGAAAFSEDEWTDLRIGRAEFRRMKPCERCPVTTIDPDTGLKLPRNEPIRTLRSYRSPVEPEDKKLFGRSPFMGVNLGLTQRGTVAVGDVVWVRGQTVTYNDSSPKSGI